ncbi:hypothetical protein [Altererythrobacter sp. ZODW24]|uniref:hypothetical protein n=1 Tax=Altererythrobacter sp. ZODW24 TaxID=2185142 RepID=UPI000DF78657|nr:hypothetical protein [Altererythrobacter sp. ZODW24]
MKFSAILPLVALLAACSGGGASYEPGPITDEQFAALQDECGISDAKLATGDRDMSFTTDSGVPVNGTIQADTPGSRTVILGKRSQGQMVELVMCLAEFQETTGAEFKTDATAAGLGF